jgi:protein TonB
MLLLLSLFYTDALPRQHLMSMLEAPSPPVQSVPAHRALAPSSTAPSEFDHRALRIPFEVPRTIASIHDEGPSSGLVGTVGDNISGVPNGIANGIPEVLRSAPVVVPKVAVQKVRMSSGVAQGLLIRQVNPQYPPLAREARIQGIVVLQATIGKDGTVQHLRVLSGHPLLIQAAIEAVKQWLYRPYYLNGEPVEVDTQISVNFTLAAE